MKSRHFFVLSALTLAASLTACGGGGGGSDTSPQAVQITPPVVGVPVVGVPVVVTTNSLVTSVSTPTYAAGSEELAAFNLLNVERGACGFGLLAQSPAIDAAAQGHSNYQVLNKTITHVQNQQTMPLGFTGTTPTERLIAARYAVTIADQTGTYEVIAAIRQDTKTGQGVSSVRGLLNAPYHMMGMLSETRDVGLAVRSGADNNSISPGVYTTIDFSSKASVGTQLPDSSSVRTYPCSGTIGAIRFLAGEIPNPVPGRDLTQKPIGSSVYINVRKGNTIGISAVSFVNVATGASVATRVPVTKANDPNGLFRAHEAYVSADAPLEKLSSYRVVITGTNNGVAFNKDFVFTTSSD